MAGSVNKVFLLGNVGKDPEERGTQGGAKIVSFSVATSETWNDKASGERKEKVEWHRVVIFNERAADVAMRFVKKGSKVHIEGALQTRKWTDQSGAEKYSTEIVISAFRGELTLVSDAPGTQRNDAGGQGYGGRSQEPARRPASQANTRGAQPSQGGWEPGPGGDLDDEIPF